MNESLNIYAAFDQPDFLRDLVQRLADRRNDNGFRSTNIPFGFRTFESSSVEAYVSGAVGIDLLTGLTEPDEIHIPFTCSFLFTCIRDKQKTFQLQWALSLS